MNQKSALGHAQRGASRSTADMRASHTPQAQKTRSSPRLRKTLGAGGDVFVLDKKKPCAAATCNGYPRQMGL